jgi:Flp pilus assembly protein TadB
MLHITVGMLVILLVVVGLVTWSFGAAAERRAAEKKKSKLEAQHRREQIKIDRQEAWSKRKADVVAKLIPWKRS